jgi:hypothetical protein
MAEYFKKFYIGENSPSYGKKLSPEICRKLSESHKGKFLGSKSPSWRGGKRTVRRRIYSYNKEHPFATKQGYVLRSRLVMEKALGRYLEPEEIVHHKNGNETDDRIENLVLMSNQEHSRFHTQERWDNKTFIRKSRVRV